MFKNLYQELPEDKRDEVIVTLMNRVEQLHTKQSARNRKIAMMHLAGFFFIMVTEESFGLVFWLGLAVWFIIVHITWLIRHRNS